MAKYHVAAVTAVLTIVAGCEKRQPATTPAATGQPKTIVVGYLPIIAHLPAAVAGDQHFFEGLAVEFRVFGTSNDLLSALARGDVQVATTVAVAPVAERVAAELADQQTPSVRLFSVSRTTKDSPFDGVFVRPSSELSDLAALVETVKSSATAVRIGVFPGSTAKAILAAFLRAKGAGDAVERIEWAQLPPNLQLEQLRNGDVHALYTYEPVRTQAKLAGMRELHGSVIASVLEGAPYGGSAFNRAFEKAFPEAAQAFVSGFERGVLFVREHPVESRRVLSTSIGLSPDVARECNLEYRLTTEELRKPANQDLFNAFLHHLRACGELQGELKASQLLE